MLPYRILCDQLNFIFYLLQFSGKTLCGRRSGRVALKFNFIIVRLVREYDELFCAVLCGLMAEGRNFIINNVYSIQYIY